MDQKKYKVSVIDDEPACIHEIELFLKQNFPDFTLVPSATNVKEGINLLEKFTPDLIFLDINLGAELSFKILDHFKELPFKIIFVTGFDQFAIKAIKFSAIDYILKPINSDELFTAIHKALKSIQSEENVALLKSQLINRKLTEKLVLNLGSSFEMVDRNQIYYLQAEGDFTNVFGEKRKFFVSQNLKQFEEMLEGHLFFRVHKSFIVNLNQIQNYSPQNLTIRTKNHHELPVSHRKKRLFEEYFMKK